MTKRQKEILKNIIEVYIEEGKPIGSKHLIERYNIKYSSATIRNEMKILEGEFFLEKAHTSSGRIPSIKGLQYYATYQAMTQNEDLSLRIKKIFKKRSVSIDVTLDKAASAIAEITKLTLVTSSSKKDDLMKSIQLTPINNVIGAIVIVASSGEVLSKIINFNESVKVEDVRIAVKIFKDRLVDSKLSELSKKIELLIPILSNVVNNYEDLVKAFVVNIFDFHNKNKNNVYGNTDLIRQHDIKREDLAELLNLIEKKSIWETIERNIDEDKTIRIEIRPNNTSLISKKINVDNETKEITIVGSHRMNYSKAKQALNLLTDLLSEKGYK